jgi:hypothetical protein
MTTAIEIGTANAISALDQWHEYDDARASFRQNVIDTIDELGLTDHRDEALAAYDAHILKGWRPNFFGTLNAALESEGLLAAWDMCMTPITYGETHRWTWDDGTKHGHLISVYRDERGMYERPLHYAR